MAAAKKVAAKKAPAKKAAASKATNMKWAKVQLPDGYTAIASGDFGEEWDYENVPLLEGVVEGEAREVEVGKGRDKKMTRVINVATSSGTYAVWESAALRQFFDKVYDGAEVAVAFQGYKDTGRPQPMKVFVAGLYGDAAGAEPVVKRGAKKTARGSRR